MTDARQPVRRIGAYLLDSCLILIWAGILFVLMTRVGEAGGIPSSWAEKLRGHLLGFATLTGPVILYFTLLEAGRGGTLGKAAFALTVVAPGGDRPGFLRALGRNLLKFLPWEVAHGAIWYVPGRPFLDPMPAPNLAASIAAIAAAAAYVGSLFIADGRTPYDRLSGTAVRRHRPQRGL